MRLRRREQASGTRFLAAGGLPGHLSGLQLIILSHVFSPISLSTLFLAISSLPQATPRAHLCFSSSDIATGPQWRVSNCPLGPDASDTHQLESLGLRTPGNPRYTGLHGQGVPPPVGRAGRPATQDLFLPVVSLEEEQEDLFEKQ